jgi:hypothetical protein
MTSDRLPAGSLDTNRLPRGSRLERLTQRVMFLKASLSGGAVLVGDLEVKARAAGLLGPRQRITNSKSFKRAKRTLQVRSLRSGFGRGGEWSWVLSNRPDARYAAARDGLSATLPERDTYGTGQFCHDRGKSIKGMEIEPDRRLPRDWIRGVALLTRQKPPSSVPRWRWQLFVVDCKRFMCAGICWAERAAELGWDGYALFGCHPDQPLAYLGDAGLLWFVTGGELVRLHQHSAVVAIHGVQHVVHRRPNSNNVTLPWQLRTR